MRLARRVNVYESKAAEPNYVSLELRGSKENHPAPAAKKKRRSGATDDVLPPAAMAPSSFTSVASRSLCCLCLTPRALGKIRTGS